MTEEGKYFFREFLSLNIPYKTLQTHFIEGSERSDPRVCALIISYMRHLLALRKDEKRNIYNIFFLNSVSTNKEKVFRVEDFVTS